MRAFAVATGFVIAALVANPACGAAPKFPGSQPNTADLAAPASGAKGDGLSIDNEPLQELLNSVPSAGATVQIPPGRYLLNAPLHMRSNTTLVCAPGATFVAAGAWLNGARRNLLRNANHDSPAMTDHDLTVENCGFDMTGQDRGNFHAINFRMAQHIRISKIRCVNGGDCTAMRGTDDVVVEDSYAKGILNACWDFWEAPTNGIVRGGYCSTRRLGAGVFITGGGGGQPNEMARNFRVDGGVYDIRGRGVAIWVMGMGAKGSNAGSSNVQITGVHIDRGLEGGACFKVSGETTDVVVSNFTCSGSNRLAVYIGRGGDNGGTPRRVLVSNGTVELSPESDMPIRIEVAGGSTERVNVVRTQRRSWQIPAEMRQWDPP